METGDVVADRFLIERLAGKGGMGEVYLARDRTSGEKVALKVMLAQHEALTARFGREARLLAELRHPGIVRYVAHGELRDGKPYIAMEWLEGEDLSARLDSAPLSLAESVVLVQRAAEALAVAHARGVVHRDLKPSNLFLPAGSIERVKLLDFGIARTGVGTRDGRHATRAVTGTGVMMGTPGYMAPEQARGDREVDVRADVFSLGCVFFECLTGRPVFVGEHTMALLAKILLEEAPRASELNADVPTDLDDLVARMLAKDPDDRPADATAVARRLAALSVMEGTAPPPVARREALTTSEQQVVSVVVALEDPLGRVDAPTVAYEQPGDRTSRLRPVAAAFGARLERLLDGSYVAVLGGKGHATDQAAVAARCALAMRAALPTAPVVVATGRGVFADRVPVGEVIDRAARLLRLALPAAVEGGPRPIRLDAMTAGLLDARFDFDGEGEGLELRGERPLDAAVGTLLGRPTPCVGRERELRTLEALADECFDEPVARAALLTAPAGIGKTRVVRELLGSFRRRAAPPEVWVARGDPMSAGSPFSMLAQAIRHACGLVDGEPAEAQRQKLAARVRRHATAAAFASIEFLAELAGAPFPDEASETLRAARRDPQRMGREMQKAWETWLAAETAAHPVVLVLEDLHWGDLPTVRLVDAGLRELGDSAFLVIASARPEVLDLFPGLWVGRAVQVLPLAELTRKAAEKLVRHVLDGLRPEVVARIVERAAGNAFYLEELIRAVARGKGDALPETVVAMVQARLERLEPACRRVLRAASVFGHAFTGGGVGALLGGQGEGGDGARTGEWLAYLCDEEVVVRVRERDLPGDEAFAFRQGPVQEAAYAMLTDRDRAVGHRLAGAWLETAGERDPLVLAEHFERGGEGARAVGWYRRAADQALRAGDLAAVAAIAGRAAACGVDGEDLGAIRAMHAEALGWSGQNEAAGEWGELAMQAAPPGSEIWSHAASLVVVAAGFTGDDRRLTDAARKLRAAGLGAVGGGKRAQAWGLACTMLCLHGHYDLARPFQRWLERFDAEVEDRDGRALGWAAIGRFFASMLCGDDPSEPLAIAEASAAYFEQAGEVPGTVYARGYTAWARLSLGLYEPSVALARETLATAQQFNVALVISRSQYVLGVGLTHLGQLDEARTYAVAAVEALAAQRNAVWETAARGSLASVHLALGELAEAEREARAAAEKATPGTPFYARTMAVLARVLLAQGSAADALEAAWCAAAVLDALGSIGDGESSVRLAAAEALHATGRQGEAAAAIAAERTRLLARADRIADPALRQSFLGRVPDNARVIALAGAWLG